MRLKKKKTIPYEICRLYATFWKKAVKNQKVFKRPIQKYVITGEG